MSRQTRWIIAVALAGMGLCGATAQAAINIEQATEQNGVAYVRGNGAAPGALITWEGFAVTTANRRNGGFSFFGILPEDCSGALSDGASSVEVAVLGCTPVTAGAPAPVARTGQTTSYEDGDDGALQKGVASPSPRFTKNVNALDDLNDNGICDVGETCNGTITDNLTELIWLQNANCAGVGRTWAQALSAVANLNATGAMQEDLLGGGIFVVNCGDTSNAGKHQTDWRLPNLRELFSLVDYGRANLALPAGHPFTNLVVGASYWSSTSYASDSDNAWGVGFTFGLVSQSHKSFNLGVIAVRGGS